MACFVVPGTEAIVTTIVQKVLEKGERKAAHGGGNSPGLGWGRKLGWLNKMLWGGTVLLLLEHIWHGEVVPFPPFLTAMRNPADTAAMLREMATVGVAMALGVTFIWAIIILAIGLKVRAVPPLEAGDVAGGG